MAHPGDADKARIPRDDVSAIEAALRRPLTLSEVEMLDRQQRTKYSHVKVIAIGRDGGATITPVREHAPRNTRRCDMRAMFHHIAECTGGKVVTKETSPGRYMMEIVPMHAAPVTTTVGSNRRTGARTRGSGRPARRRTRSTSSSSGDDSGSSSSDGEPPSASVSHPLTLAKGGAK